MKITKFFLKCFTDPNSGDPSASRFNLTMVSWAGIWISLTIGLMGIYLILQGNTTHLAAILTAIGGIISVIVTANAGVYYASTKKDSCHLKELERKKSCPGDSESEVGEK